ncbi:hypothetical protein [Bradyrhizobium japonicum]|uniref:hypothetical protein n=1 Tax=Bradyrhizobium japonicum TaxID=375 RepID=UPI001BACA679|nr:hypothetical protein [Bradyrhizobium japonicum]MBR0956592.1 hypothetical protein [Bradyrhizobium japonicum]
MLIAVLIILALCTFRDYAVSNDEVVQHQYGKLILDYYQSGLRNRNVFGLDNLYLYGGLFDIVAVALAQLIPIDAFDLRHILCALIGISGIAATAATARLIAGPRAGLLAASSLALCGPWYGAMFNHTKDIPFAAAMMGAMLVLIRIGQQMSSPSPRQILSLGLLAGAALGLRVLGLLIVIYIGFAAVLYGPRSKAIGVRWRDAATAGICMLPAVVVAYLVMIIAWPWSALSPLNPIRGLLAFSDYQYQIRTYFAGSIYRMGEVPRAFIPMYILIRVPLLTLAGAAIAVVATLARLRANLARQQRDVALLSLTIVTPLACQVIFRGPAFTGMRHFLFVIPPLAVLAGIGLDRVLAIVEPRRRIVASSGVAVLGAFLMWDASVLFRLHPYENLYYNPLAGGLAGAFRRYDLDYWFNSMPEAVNRLETFVRDTGPLIDPAQVYSVAVCGERVSFERAVTLPQLRWDFKPDWNQSEFFIAPTHMDCDRDLDGKIVSTIERFGVPVAYVKDRRSLVGHPATTAAWISHLPGP